MTITRILRACLLVLVTTGPALAQDMDTFTAFERTVTGYRYSREQAHDPSDAVQRVPSVESFLLAPNGQYRARSELNYPGKIKFLELTIGSLEGSKTIDELKWREGLAIVEGSAAESRVELADSLFISPQLLAPSQSVDVAGRPMRVERDAGGRALSIQVADTTYRYAEFRCPEASCQPNRIQVYRGENLAAEWQVAKFEVNVMFDAALFKLPDGYVAANPSRPLRLVGLGNGVYRVDGTKSGYHSGVVKGMHGIAIFDPSVSVEEAAQIRKLVEAQFPGTPITHVILSHAHGDHVRGLPTYLGESTTVLAGDGASLALKRMFGDVAVARAIEVKQPYKLDLGGMAIDVIPVKSTHAKTMLMAYVASARLIFDGDLFYIPEQGPVPTPFEGAGELAAAIRGHRLAVETIVGVHGRTGSFAELQAALRRKNRPGKD